MVQEEVRFDGLLYFRERKTVCLRASVGYSLMGVNSFTGLLQIREFPEVIFLVC